MSERKKSFWENEKSWEKAEAAWEKGAEKASLSHPIKGLKVLPQMPGIAEKRVKWKGLSYLIREDEKKIFPRHFFKRPFYYTFSLLRSYLKKESYVRSDDFFLYGIPSLSAFEKLLTDPNTLFLLGFSYCHKPFECPSGRFTDKCLHDPDHPICRQCFIGKAINASPKQSSLAIIPTIHYIGEKIFELVEKNPDKKIVFIITACEMTLEMFSDWGNMVGAKGIGVRLDGRICNTMKAFTLSEKGIKPGLTVVLKPTQQQILKWLRLRGESL